MLMISSPLFGPFNINYGCALLLSAIIDMWFLSIKSCFCLHINKLIQLCCIPVKFTGDQSL